MERIRYGMVGGGEGAFIGAVHRMAARLDDAWELVCGAFSCDAAALAAFRRSARRCRRRACTTNYARMMASEAVLPADERMQVVVIVTPNRSHLPIALAAFERGFHVLSDKPATATLAECRELAVAAAAAAACATGSRIPTRAYPMIREARARVAHGELGHGAQGGGRIHAGLAGRGHRVRRAEAGGVARRSGAGRRRLAAWATSACMPSSSPSSCPAST